MHRRSAFLLLLLAGCGSPSVVVVTPPERGFGGFGRAQIRDVKVELRHPVSEGWQTEAKRDAGPLRAELVQKLKDAGLFQREGPSAVIETRVVEYSPEYTEPRLGGGGGGLWKVSITLDVRILDEKGAVVARVESQGISETRGWTIASTSAARSRALQAILRFFEEHRGAP